MARRISDRFLKLLIIREEKRSPGNFSRFGRLSRLQREEKRRKEFSLSLDREVREILSGE